MTGSSDRFPSTHVSLLSRLRDRGNDRAWREFEERYRDLLLRFSRRRGLQPADAEDVVQSVFLSLSRCLPGFRYDPAVGRFRDYLFRAVRNAIGRWKNCPDRAAIQLDMDGDLFADAGDQPTTDERATWEAEWAAHHYRRALARLRESGEERMVRLLERSFDGANAESLAFEFEISVEGIYKARQRARQRLQDLVAEQIREEDDFPQ